MGRIRFPVPSQPIEVITSYQDIVVLIWDYPASDGRENRIVVVFKLKISHDFDLFSFVGREATKYLRTA